MIATLLAHYYNTPESTRQAARNWYRDAHADLADIASDYNLPLSVVCAICAVISPRLDWRWNVYETVKIIEGKTNWLHATKTNVTKAQHILETGDVDAVSGPKVSNFYRNLLNPDDTSSVTIDKRAGQLWGYQFKRGKAVRPYHYEKIASDYRQAAALTGLLPSEFQAIIWQAARQGDIKAV